MKKITTIVTSALIMMSCGEVQKQNNDSQVHGVGKVLGETLQEQLDDVNKAYKYLDEILGLGKAIRRGSISLTLPQTLQVELFLEQRLIHMNTLAAVSANKSLQKKVYDNVDSVLMELEKSGALDSNTIKHIKFRLNVARNTLSVNMRNFQIHDYYKANPDIRLGMGFNINNALRKFENIDSPEKAAINAYEITNYLEHVPGIHSKDEGKLVEEIITKAKRASQKINSDFSEQMTEELFDANFSLQKKINQIEVSYNFSKKSTSTNINKGVDYTVKPEPTNINKGVDYTVKSSSVNEVPVSASKARYENFKSLNKAAKLEAWKKYRTAYIGNKLRYPDFWKKEFDLITPLEKTQLFAIKDFMTDPDRVFKRLLELDEIVAKRMELKGESSETALENVLTALEKKHGFGEAKEVTKNLNSISHILKEGRPIRDKAFIQYSGHGQQTHRIQWAVILLEKHSIPDLKSAKGVDLYKLFSRKMHKNNNIAGNAWSDLFDSFEDNFTHPEWLTNTAQKFMPNLVW